MALPVFAARTHNSVGCGEFLDLIPLIEFSDAAGMRLIQVRAYQIVPAGFSAFVITGVANGWWGALVCRVSQC